MESHLKFQGAYLDFFCAQSMGDLKKILNHDADFRKNSFSGTHLQLNFSFLFGKGTQEFQKVPLKEKNYLKICKTILFDKKYSFKF